MNDALNIVPPQRKTMFFFAASSTWLRIGSIVSAGTAAVMAVAPLLGFEGNIDPGQVDRVLESGEQAAVAIEGFFQEIVLLAVAAKLWSDADTKRETGKADLVVGRAVISPAGDTPYATACPAPVSARPAPRARPTG